MAQKNTIHDILTQREDFMVIGLTGRMGSGCSKVADVLATPFEEMNFPHPTPQPGMRSLTEEERAVRIIAEYAEAHWLKFDVVQVGAIIATFILNNDSRFINDLNNGDILDRRSSLRKTYREGLLESFYRELVKLGKDCGLLGKDQNTEYIKLFKTTSESEETKEQKNSDDYTPICEKFSARNLLDDTYTANLKQELHNLGKKLSVLVHEDKEILDFFDDHNDKSFQRALLGKGDSATCWNQVSKNMSSLYREIPQRNAGIPRCKYLEYVNQLLVLFSVHCLINMWEEVRQKGPDIANALWDRLREINESVEPNAEENGEVLQIQKFVFVKYISLWFGRFIRKFITDTLGNDAYTRLFQRYGQMIRFHSNIPVYTEKECCEEVGGTENQENNTGNGSDTDRKKDDIFAIPRKINQYIKVLRHPFSSKDHRPVRVVIDSIKNVFEAVYLRYRYSAFYLWAITTDVDIREQRLHKKHLTDTQVRMMDWNEYPDKGREVIIAADKIMEESNLTLGEMSQLDIIRKTLTEKLKQAEVNFYLDSLANRPLEQEDPQVAKARNKYYKDNEIFNEERRKFFRNNTYPFYTQDIDSCVCNADVYLFNNAISHTDTQNNRKLLEEVVRNVSLVMYPCLVRPTPVERCMQIAFSAKVNSGCLSRQVGAVVTDAQYNILAIGWNDVPCGEVPCAYKNLNDISSGADQDAYSEYELHNTGFRDRIAEYINPSVNLRGLPFSYCFKNVHKDVKDPMRSRAMHAEEKALALCSREAEGGYLFTTSSPCEMCSKNAKNHKIKKIYYLEAYPGISQAQYTNSGDKANRAELILFSGAVGRAYMQMYTPLLPHKDVLEYLGVRKK